MSTRAGFFNNLLITEENSGMQAPVLGFVPESPPRKTAAPERPVGAVAPPTTDLD